MNETIFKTLFLLQCVNVRVFKAFIFCFKMFLHKIYILGRAQANAGHTAEYNFFADPEAAHIVLNSSIVPSYILPWSTGIQAGLTWVSLIGIFYNIKYKSLNINKRN